MAARRTQRFVCFVGGLAFWPALWLGGLGSSLACWQLDRQLVPGRIEGRAVDDTGAAVPFVRVSVDGAAAVVGQGDAEGHFVVAGLGVGVWLLRLADDGDGDGIGDRRAVRAVSLPAALDGRPAGALLGDVVVSDTVAVVGVVVDEAGAPLPGATVVAWRRSADTPGDIESNAVTDVDGAFALRALAAGALQVFAIDADRASAAVGVPAPATSPETSTATSTATALTVTAAPIDGKKATVTVRFSLDGVAGARDELFNDGFEDGFDSDGDVDLWVVARGRPPVGNPTARASLARTTSFEVRPGVYDVHAVRVRGTGRGVLLGQVAVPDNGDGGGSEDDDDKGSNVWGPMLLQTADPCRRADGVDVDGDGVVGLPVVDLSIIDGPLSRARVIAEHERRLWASCGDVCLADAGAVCASDDVSDDVSNGGARFDCDDDGDGQADVSEALACLGACGGSDLDLDGVCDRFDSAPPCGDDDPGLCLLPVPVLLPAWLVR